MGVGHSSWALTMCLCVSLLGCASGRDEVRAHPVASLVEALNHEGQGFRDPFALDEATREEVRRTVGEYGSFEERLQRVVEVINGPDGQGFRYVRNVTLTAQQAYRTRAGDCMTFAALTVAMARSVGVRAYFVFVNEMPVHYDDAGWLFSANHMAVGLQTRTGSVVVDFVESRDGLPSWVYREVEDLYAAALFFNNRAVERLIGGDTEGAEAVLRGLTGFAPGVRESWANLGTVLLREGRNTESLAVSERALTRFGDFAPLWNNAVLAARAIGDDSRAQKYEREGERVSQSDPFFHFTRGVAAYHAKDYPLAIDCFERAASKMKDGSLVRAWLVRAFLSAGQVERGRALFSELRKEFSDDPSLDVLVHEFPTLAPDQPLHESPANRDNPDHARSTLVPVLRRVRVAGSGDR